MRYFGFVALPAGREVDQGMVTALGHSARSKRSVHNPVRHGDAALHIRVRRVALHLARLVGDAAGAGFAWLVVAVMVGRWVG